MKLSWNPACPQPLNIRKTPPSFIMTTLSCFVVVRVKIHIRLTGNQRSWRERDIRLQFIADGIDRLINILPGQGQCCSNTRRPKMIVNIILRTVNKVSLYRKGLIFFFHFVTKDFGFPSEIWFYQYVCHLGLVCLLLSLAFSGTNINSVL